MRSFAQPVIDDTDDTAGADADNVTEQTKPTSPLAHVDTGDLVTELQSRYEMCAIAAANRTGHGETRGEKVSVAIKGTTLEVYGLGQSILTSAQSRQTRNSQPDVEQLLRQILD